MITRLYQLKLFSAALLLGLAGSGNAIAQQETGASMPRPGTDRASCNAIEWHRDMLRDYPWVADACQEAVTVNGQKWARLEAEFQTFSDDGILRSNFRDDRGRSLGSIDLMPDSDQRVLLDGRPRMFSELRRGQVLNFYLPQGGSSFATEPVATPSAQLRLAERPNESAQRQLAQAELRLAERWDEQQRLDDQPREDQSRNEPTQRQLAQANRSGSTRPAVLPATAGPLPLLALGGICSLLGGFALSTRRRLAQNKKLQSGQVRGASVRWIRTGQP